jgi:hypothetical protein
MLWSDLSLQVIGQANCERNNTPGWVAAAAGWEYRTSVDEQIFYAMDLQVRVNHTIHSVITHSGGANMVGGICEYSLAQLFW